MTFRITSDRLDITLDFCNVKSACNYVLENSYKFSNFSILKQDTTVVSCKNEKDGEFYILAYIDLGLNEVYYQSFQPWAKFFPPEVIA